MTRKTELEELQLRAQTLGDLLDAHHGQQVSCAEALAIARAGTRKAVRLAEEGNERAARAEEQRDELTNANVTLATERETALGALGAMPTELRTLRRVLTDFIVEARTGNSTAGIVFAGRLESELADAGIQLGAAVDILTQLGGGS